MSSSLETDQRWMRRALELAARGRYGTSPNPMVGALVVDPGGQLVGEGFHAHFGGPHAEVIALEAASTRARGGTLYVTLEPCTHHGKTAPCVDAVLAAEVRRVVVALRDPNPGAGGGVERLQAAGVEVTVGPGSEGSRLLNRRWLCWATRRRPWVTLKAAISIDGRIATHSGQSRWITGEAARRRSLELREEHDAILVGVETILADDSRLTRRAGLNPLDLFTRIVLDSQLRTPPGAAVVTEAPHQTMIVHLEGAPEERQQQLVDRGARLLAMPATGAGRVDLGLLLTRLASEPIASLLVEGGSTVHGAFVDARLVDEVCLFMAPTLIGGVAAPVAVAGAGVAELHQAQRLVFERVRHCGDDLELHAVIAEDADVHRTG